ncbi:hypothetical protein ACERK3_07670 [Phycisphaerales bacterium AB-hyl4]|uniref:Uncharacterized protein n=1 Tax=Natronomicrosphaera hydrolytica TaxID=3242702 RepID=A0ABV4U3K0_9BACT
MNWLAYVVDVEAEMYCSRLFALIMYVGVTIGMGCERGCRLEERISDLTPVEQVGDAFAFQTSNAKVIVAVARECGIDLWTLYEEAQTKGHSPLAIAFLLVVGEDDRYVEFLEYSDNPINNEEIQMLATWIEMKYFPGDKWSTFDLRLHDAVTARQ